MEIAAWGSIALGLMWGWLAGMRTPRRLSLRTLLALVIATGSVAWTVWLAGNEGEAVHGRALWFFLGATALAYLLYGVWQQALRRRVQRQTQRLARRVREHHQGG